MSYGVVLIGLGAIGIGYDLGFSSRDYVRTHARAFRQHDAFALLAGVDPDPARRRLLEAEYATASYRSVRTSLEALRPDVVAIATPTASHATILREVLERSQPSLILCEKPLADNIADAEEMVALCRSRGVQLYVNYMRRADPGAIGVRDMIRERAIRPPLKAVVWYSKGLIHNGSHFIDLMRYWLGAAQSAHIIRRGRLWDGRDPEPDFALEQAQCSSVFLAAHEECFSHYTVEIMAGNGRLRYEEGGGRIEWQEVCEDPDFPGYRVLTRQTRLLSADMTRSQLNVVKQLVVALREEIPMLCSGHEALETLRDVHRVLELL